MNLRGIFQQADFGREFLTRNYALQAELDIDELSRKVRFLLGIGFLDHRPFRVETFQGLRTGPLLGFVYTVPHPVRLQIHGKAVIYGKDTWYEGRVSREFRWIDIFAAYTQMDTFREMSLGASFIFSYGFRKRRKFKEGSTKTAELIDENRER